MPEGKKTPTKRKATPRKRAPAKKKIGRPTTYRPAYCAKLIEFGKLGLSKAQMRSRLNVSLCAWQNWEKKHPEFKVAVKDAQELAMAWWEDQGMDGMFRGMKFNATAFIFQVKNRFPEHYRDRKEHEVKSETTTTVVLEKPEFSKDETDTESLKKFEQFRQGLVVH